MWAHPKALPGSLASSIIPSPHGNVSPHFTCTSLWRLTHNVFLSELCLIILLTHADITTLLWNCQTISIVDFLVSAFTFSECAVSVTPPTFRYPASAFKYPVTGRSAVTRSLFSSAAASNPLIAFPAAPHAAAALATFLLVFAVAYSLMVKGKVEVCFSLSSPAPLTGMRLTWRAWPEPPSFRFSSLGGGTW